MCAVSLVAMCIQHLLHQSAQKVCMLCSSPSAMISLSPLSLHPPLSLSLSLPPPPLPPLPSYPSPSFSLPSPLSLPPLSPPSLSPPSLLLPPPLTQDIGMEVCYSENGRRLPEHVPDECNMVFVCELFSGPVYDRLVEKKFRCTRVKWKQLVHVSIV